MSERLPPLKALRMFEVAGRCGSFKRAASELNVTPGAVSRQIKALEIFLGVDLFDRGGRDLRITDAGRAYVDPLKTAFGLIDEATRRVRVKEREQPLHIHSAMTFASRWLMPRLPEFHRLYPDRDISLTTCLAALPPHLAGTGGADGAIQLGRGQWDGRIAHRLAGGELAPVCSPALLSAGPPLRTADDLTRHTLLHSLARPHEWRDWLIAAGARGVDPGRGLRFASANLAYHAAIEGMGVAIGQLSLLRDELESGRLVPALDFVLRGENDYYFTYPPHAAKSRQLTQFRDWILTEADRHDAARPPPLAVSA